MDFAYNDNWFNIIQEGLVEITSKLHQGQSNNTPMFSRSRNQFPGASAQDHGDQHRSSGQSI